MAKTPKEGKGQKDSFSSKEVAQGYKVLSKGCNYDDMGKWNSEHQDAGTDRGAKRKEQSY